MVNYDFCGYATRNNIRCADGRTIMRDAFKGNDGETVPIVWNHQHNDPSNVLGHGLLENRPDGVFIYGKFNDTENGQNAKIMVDHGDIKGLSIYANHLKQNGGNVMHGEIREVSLVLAGANPGAYIQSVIKHGDTEASDDEAYIYMGENIALSHSDEQKEENEMAENNTNMQETNDETIADVFETLSEKQKTAVYAMVGMALEESGGDADDDFDEEDYTMKHNLFDSYEPEEAYLSHSDEMDIIKMAKNGNVGTFQNALELFAQENDTLSHGADETDLLFPDSLFPEYKDVRPGAPELLTTDQGWITKVLNKVHKSPISRIRTRQADIRDITEMRAKGYKKGTKKTEVGNLKLVGRTTDPTTIYVKSKLDRDDIVDITDFDVVGYLYGIDRQNLNEELATAIMLGDGREDGDDGKIDETKIRPVWTDDDLYTIHADVDLAKMKAELQGTNTSANFGENYIYAESVIQTLLYAREKYKGSGTPDFYCTPHLLNVMLLARDLNGRRIYDNVNELKAALNVGEIITAEQFEGKIRTTKDGKSKKLLGIMYNLADYSLGATKGGEISHFTDFDIDFNQQKSLLETRCSGANTRVLSAIALEQDVTSASTGG